MINATYRNIKTIYELLYMRITIGMKNITKIFLLTLFLTVLPAFKAEAATITTSSSCRFVDAVASAETNTSVNGCLAGSGADTIIVGQDEIVETGTGVITSQMYIRGNGHTIIFDNIANSPDRLFTIIGGSVDMSDVTFHNATSSQTPEEEYGGFATVEGGIALDNVTVTSFRAHLYGGVMDVCSNSVNISNSNFNNNAQTGQGYLLGGGVISVSCPSNIKISNSIFGDNKSAGGQGGVILSLGANLDIDSSIFENNKARFGSVLNLSSWNPENRVKINDSEFSNNQSVEGGAIVWQGPLGSLIVQRSLFAKNIGINNGGAAFSYSGSGHITIINSTFSQNRSGGRGAAILNDSNNPSVVRIAYNTFIKNISENGQGGLAIESYNVWGDTALENNLFTQNSGGDCYLPNTTGLSVINNLSDDGSCGTNVATGVQTNLSNNGGQTRTHALMNGSSAIDSADTTNPNLKVRCPATDQRGVSRAYDGDGDGFAKCDVGAYEFNQRVLIQNGSTKIDKLEIKDTASLSKKTSGGSVDSTSENVKVQLLNKK